MDMEVGSEPAPPRNSSSMSLEHQQAVALNNGTAEMIVAPGLEAGSKMDPHSGMAAEDEGGGGKLKRSCSAPMINQLVPQARVSAPPTPPRVDIIAADSAALQPRARRFSASFGPVSPMSPGGSSSSNSGGGGATSSSGRTCSRMRVRQLREEEGMDIANREVAHEREVQSSLQMARSLSQSCEDLAIDDDHRKKEPRPRLDYSDPLHLNIGLAAASLSCATSPCPPAGAASPTRPGRQCFSPSLQQCVRNSPFTPSPSKRPSAFMARRSLSPITPRSSPLRTTVKRKFEASALDEFATPSKRLSVGGAAAGHEGGLLMTRPHSMESSCGPAPSSGLTHSTLSSASLNPAPPTLSLTSHDTPAQHFQSSFSSFKQFTPANTNVFQSHPSKESLSMINQSQQVNPQFNNCIVKNSPDTCQSSFENFNRIPSEPLRTFSNFGNPSQPFQANSVFLPASNSLKNPFSVNSSSNNLNKPFLLQSCVRVTRPSVSEPQNSDNPFLQSSSVGQGGRGSPFQCMPSDATSHTVTTNNPFLRSDSHRSPFTGSCPVDSSSSSSDAVISCSGAKRDQFPVSSSRSNISNNPHLFRPVSPAAVNPSVAGHVADAPLPSTPAGSGAADSTADAMMITDDTHELHHSSNPSSSTSQLLSGSGHNQSSPSAGVGLLHRYQQSFKPVRSQACGVLRQTPDSPSASAVGVVSSSSSSASATAVTALHRSSMDSNKSFQEMDLSEDGSNQATADM